jgi:hypothetical protein
MRTSTEKEAAEWTGCALAARNPERPLARMKKSLILWFSTLLTVVKSRLGAARRPW